ncbi:DJ-1/PfpI family protein [Ectobacillus panaciterrae]|uniref:DJ-1/PfpI family protein n=1 Tax=Ectobacillus panaciterrae TaxID=363872 RepID=UPI00040935F9|nr:DJ-1/PfpI family protein [Ectobacillus panaciterrae]
MEKKVLILAGDAVEALEVYYPYYRLLEEGYEATLAAPKQKKLHTVVHDFEDWDTYTEKPGYGIEATASFADVDPTEYAGLIIPGGRAPEYIRMNEHVPAIVRHFIETDKPILAFCHGALLFTVVRDALQNRRLTAYTACKPEVEALGAEYVTAGCYVDRNLITGHAWNNLPDLMREFMKQMKAVMHV